MTMDIHAEYRRIADLINADPAVIEAIAVVETAGRTGFLADGRPRILYEPHVFGRNSGHQFTESHPHLSRRGWDRHYRYGTLVEQWDKLNEAMVLHRDAAIKACSWGRAQILGENFWACGFVTPGEMFWACHSVAGQRHMTLNFAVSNPRLIAAITSKSWHDIARIYNGSGYAQHGYHTRLENAYHLAKRRAS